MDYTLPTSFAINGTDYAIRSDYRAALDCIEALNDPELSEEEKGVAALYIIYENPEKIKQTDAQEAINRLLWFIGGGSTPGNKQSRKIMDWTQDFPLIVGAVNRVIGQDVRAMPYLHWFTFLAAYMEIGDCFFAQVVRIRDKKARGKKLEKEEQDFYRNNRSVIDFKTKYTEAELDFIRKVGGGA